MNRSSKPVAIWLIIGVIMLVVQILLGGITRLTGSGLSITEWNVITGTLPPLNAQQWMIEFDKYKQTPQFQFLNFDFTLNDFKFIFFWEWLHRFWARFMGFVFIVPFFVFLFQKRFNSTMVKPFIALFLFGALQGAVGWIMVASGLTGDALYVKPVKLALHFIFAIGLLCYTFWFALQLLISEKQIVINSLLRKLTLIILLILSIQLIFGALMAGHKAATAAPTWPNINGYFIPENLSFGLAELMEDKISIHFIHRTLAYLIFILVAVWTSQSYRIKENLLFTKTRFIPLLLVIIQLGLGIFCVIVSPQIIPNRWGVFEWVAQLHQLMAILFLLSLVWMLFLTSKISPTTK
ncbi:MAG: heme A synthase [Chitinophagaceae bacterium]|nr:MAG: heme A synthase [Chitinophagaceae bacterium]